MVEMEYWSKIVPGTVSILYDSGVSTSGSVPSRVTLRDSNNFPSESGWPHAHFHSSVKVESTLSETFRSEIYGVEGEDT